MQKTLNCIVVEDEMIFRKSIESFIRKISFLNLLGSYESPLEIKDENLISDIDIAFLDIITPGESGIEFGLRLRELGKEIIFTTSNSELGVQAFNLEACDYLIKPYEFKRFERAVKKAAAFISLQNLSDSSNELYGLNPDEIIYIEKNKDYLLIHHDNGELKLKRSLRSFINDLPKDTSLLRIHKSFAVNKERISKIERDYITIEDFKLPLSRNGRTDLVDDLKVL